MPVSVENVRKRLKDFDLTGLLIEELGWNCYAAQPLIVSVGGADYILKPLAEKCGMVVYACGPGAGGALPPYPLRRKIEQQVRKTAHEHLIIFSDARQTTQTWQWVKRQAGKGAACREHPYRAGQSGQPLVEKLQGLAFELEEEERLTITDVTARARSALDVERVTKRFYDRFKKEHQAFLKLIEGIDERTDRDWYASLMLNRMMFVYFIQKRGFLDGDPDYLRNRLQMVQERRGKGKFLSFYRFFLLRLFHEGLGKPAKDRARDLEALLGRVPYLNGGLFDVHELERQYSGIDIPDEAFEAIFDFFDSYTWHLDERPLRADNEINPDVLGYIFEKYINQKQMGAYYTKEDITGYIGRNTIIPYLFDAAQKECPIAFRPDGGIWRLLRDDPDRYIYPAVRSGVVNADGTIVPESMLPEFVREGMADPKKRMFNRQYNLGQASVSGPDGGNLALPTETWREYIERRKRCLELRAKLADGEVQSINDFITLNLDIEQFAEDVIINSEGPELVRAFWRALTRISILDPTCGSGAFLFAALNILEPLYNACLDGMQGFLEDLEHSERKHSPKKLSDFRQVLDEMAKHPNRRYFVLKSIVINNLYGVDIMDEAVEICKLRLFLKLVAQVEQVAQIEPLPDIDFNVRAGNTLVGFTSLDAVRDAMTVLPDGQRRMPYAEDEDALRRIEEESELADRAFQFFHEMQTKHDMDAAEFANAKAEVRRRLDSLRDELNRHLAREYGVRVDKRGELDKWASSYKSFHWFVEFYGIIKAGGFDAVIGNPPYVEYRKASQAYEIRQYQTLSCSNLWAYVLERSLSLISDRGGMALIVPLSLVSAEKMLPCFNLLRSAGGQTSFLTLSGDAHPSVLFDGVKMSFTIVTHRCSETAQSTMSVTKLYRWLAEERPHLFPCVSYVPALLEIPFERPAKINGHVGREVLRKMCSRRQTLGSQTVPDSRFRLLYHRIVRHFVKCVLNTPYFWNERDGEKKSEDYKEIFWSGVRELETAKAVLVSSAYYVFFLAFSDSYHCGRELVLGLPADLGRMGKDIADRLASLGKKHEEDLFRNSKRRRIEYRATGWIEYDEFYPRLSKPIVDEIDAVLARHYGFTEDELDFIINYEIKYRMGQQAEELDEE